MVIGLVGTTGTGMLLLFRWRSSFCERLVLEIDSSCSSLRDKQDETQGLDYGLVSFIGLDN